MSDKRVWASLGLLLAAAIWGLGFVPQRSSMEVIGPFTFSAMRFTLGGLALLPLLAWQSWRRHRNGSSQTPDNSEKTGLKSMLLGGALLGVLIFGGASMQQIGLVYTTAGKTAFITGLYVVLVPLLMAIFWRQPAKLNAWLGIGLAVPGLYLLSMQSGFRLAPGDGWVLAGAFVWALHLIAISQIAPGRDPVKLAFIQFMVCALLSFLVALALEQDCWPRVLSVWPGVVYAGVVSIGAGFTLQMTAQKFTPPTPTAIILSMEAVFGALAGWMFLGETMNARMLAGAGLMLLGMLLAQLPAIIKRPTRPQHEMA